MIAFHLIAAALSALVLARGEAALFGLFSALRRFVLLGARPIIVDLPPRSVACARASVVARVPPGLLLSTSPRRGPRARQS